MARGDYNATVDWGASGRTDEYWADLVDPWTLSVIRNNVQFIPEETSVTYGLYTDNLVEATITIANDTYFHDKKRCLIRLWHQCTLPSGEWDQEPLGTFFVNDDPASYKYGLQKQVLKCYGPVYRLTQDNFANDYIRKAGETVEGGIRSGMDFCTFQNTSNLYEVGPDVNAYKVHTRDVWFQIGENRAESYRTICGWCGWILWYDDYGKIRIDKYYEPKDRPIMYTFEPGVNCTYEAGYSISREGDVYNRVIAWWSRDKVPTHPRKNGDGSYAKDSEGKTIYDNDDNFGLSDRVTIDLPQSHENSADAMGRLQTYVLQVTQPCSHDDLSLQATQYLNEHCGDIQYIEISHVGIPWLRPGHVVSYQNTTDNKEGVNYICEITQISISSLGPGMKCSTKLKVITQAPLPTDVFKRKATWSDVGTIQCQGLLLYTHYQVSKGVFK